MEDEKAAGRVPPYTSYRTLKTFIEDLKSQGLPSRIDRSVWGARFSGSVGTQLMSALRFLGLLGAEDEPTDHLQSLVDAFGSDGWKKELRGVLERSYAPVMSLKLEQTSPGQLVEAFRANYRAQEAVLQKSLTFFLHAAQDAEIPLSPRIVKTTRRVARARGGFGRRRRAEPAESPGVLAQRDSSRSGNGKAPTRTAYEALIEILDPNTMEENELQAVWTLIQYLKKQGKA